MRVLQLFTLIVIVACSGSHDSIYFRESNIINESSNYNLLVFFSEKDCITCLGEFDSYNKLSENLHEANLVVQGITNIGNDSLLNKYKIKNGIKFDVLSNKKIFNKYIVGETPQSILIDVKRNKMIVFRSFRKKNISSQQTTYDIINLIVRNSF